MQNRHLNDVLNKRNDTIKDLSAEQLMERLNLETTYFYSENGIEVLNAPVRTFGNYKRVILSLTKNNITNSYILTYPNPNDTKLFYVSRLNGVILQKVTIGDDGIGVIEDYKSLFEGALKPSQNYMMRGGSCTETVYQACSSGNHSFGSGNAMDCTYWHNLSAGTPPQVFQVPSECNDGGDSGGGGGSSGDSGGNGGGGGGYNTPPPGNGGLPNNLTPIDCVTGLDCENCELPPDLNNDCEVTYEEAHFYVFLQNLNQSQLSAFNNLNENNKTRIFNYLITNEFNESGKNFAIAAINALINNGEVDFENKIINGIKLNSNLPHCVSSMILNLMLKNPENSSTTRLIDEVFSALGNSMSINNRDFITEYKVDDISGNGKTVLEFNPTTQKYEATITLSQNLINNGTKLAIAKTILHESIHSFLKYTAKQFPITFIDPEGDFSTLVAAWQLHKNENYAHHVYMTTLIEEMATNIGLFLSENYSYPDPIGNPQTLFYYESVVWSGIAEIRNPSNPGPDSAPNIIENPLFVDNYPNLTDRNNIKKIIHTENGTQSFSGYSPLINNNCN